MRIGFGYDVHQLVEGRPLTIGGVQISFQKGLKGHSDADVLVHAIMDALLGALALGDIGKHFPDTDESYRGADSLELLAEVKKIIGFEGYEVNNIDTTIVAQKPKIAPYIQSMREKIALVLDTDISNISIKATTTEGLGFAGRQEGIASYAVVTVKKTL